MDIIILVYFYNAVPKGRCGIYFYLYGAVPGGKGWKIFLQFNTFCHLARLDNPSIAILILGIFLWDSTQGKGWKTFIIIFIWYNTWRQGFEYIPSDGIVSVT
jgi:hypothetical protein